MTTYLNLDEQLARVVSATLMGHQKPVGKDREIRFSCSIQQLHPCQSVNRGMGQLDTSE